MESKFVQLGYGQMIATEEFAAVVVAEATTLPVGLGATLHWGQADSHTVSHSSHRLPSAATHPLHAHSWDRSTFYSSGSPANHCPWKPAHPGMLAMGPAGSRAQRLPRNHKMHHFYFAPRALAQGMWWGGREAQNLGDWDFSNQRSWDSI